MITIAEAIQSVQSMYSKGVQSKDVRLTPRHIYSTLLSARATILRQQSNRGQNINYWIYQLLPSVELVKASAYNVSGVPDNGVVFLRSKYKMPRLISDREKELINPITTLDGEVRFSIGKFENQKYAKGNKFTGTKANAYLREGYLYFTGIQVLKAVPVEGLFYDPIEVFQFPRLEPCEECACKNIMELEFPIDGNLLEQLTDIAYSKLLRMFSQMNEDKFANARDDNERNMVHQSNQQPQE